jgi:putative transposase
LIRDRDKKFGNLFSALATHSGIEVIQTPYRTPNPAFPFQNKTVFLGLRMTHENLLLRFCQTTRESRAGANAFCERFMGSLKRECLDRSLVLHQRHLNRLVKEYRSYFNEERPHQGINQRIPDRLDRLPIIGSGEIRSVAFLGGLHQSYSRASGCLQANLPGG